MARNGGDRQVPGILKNDRGRPEDDRGHPPDLRTASDHDTVSLEVGEKRKEETMIGRVQAWTEAKYSTLTKRATQMPFFMEKAIDIKCLHIEDSEAAGYLDIRDG